MSANKHRKYKQRNKSILLAKEEAEEEEVGEEITKWWDNENPIDSEEEIQGGYEVEQKESEETLERKRLLSIIAAQEKARWLIIY